MWGITAVSAIAIAWTMSYALTEALARSPREDVARAVAVAILALAALASASGLAVEGAGVEPDDAASSRALRVLTPGTVDAISGGSGSAAGHRGRYLVTWTDPVGIVGELLAFGLANELDRAGVDTGFARVKRLRAAPEMVIDASHAAGVLRVVTGPGIAVWEQRPGVRRLAVYDPRTTAQRLLQDQLRAEIDDDLRALGLDELIPEVHTGLVGATFAFDANPDIPEALIAKMGRALKLGTPSAVFLEPGQL